ncbi:DUF3558 domain-containing protein [Actinosynnema sp. NPDC020468]|uniref:DUF3558 domain-containing protein n=1 Tax=Actinosynnema sp. NPDC020468 TaxID=3154488 RepID=UPI0033F95712
MRRALTLLVAAVLLAGCSETTTGSPSPDRADPTSAGPTSTTSAPSSSPATSKAKAVRPKTIDIGDVDPCSLLTDAQRAQVGLNRPPAKSVNDGTGWPNCVTSREDRLWVLNVALSPSTGVEYYTDGHLPANVENVQVGGFPAVRVSAKSKGTTNNCTVAVDVSDHQLVDVKVSSFGETSQEKTCELAPQIAELVIATLASR